MCYYYYAVLPGEGVCVCVWLQLLGVCVCVATGNAVTVWVQLQQKTEENKQRKLVTTTPPCSPPPLPPPSLTSPIPISVYHSVHICALNTPRNASLTLPVLLTVSDRRSNVWNAPS